MDCSICKYPAIGQCSSTRNFFCSKICQRIGFKLIGPKNERGEEIDEDEERKKQKQKEEEDVDPFTQEKISDLDPKDVIKIRNNSYSLPDLYKWVVDMKRTRNPLTNEEFVGPDTLEMIKDTANKVYPLQVIIKYVSGGSPVTRNYTILLMIENLAFLILEVMTGSITETVMEFMQSIVNQNISFLINNNNILDFLLKYDTQRIIDVMNQNPITIYYVQILSPEESNKQVQKCIEIAKMLGKGTDVFERRLLRQKIMVLRINDDEYVVNIEPGESLYDAFYRTFNDNYHPSSRHNEWLQIIGTIEGTGLGDSNTEGYFPFHESDFEGLGINNDIIVKIYEEYVPPMISIIFYTDETLAQKIDLNPETMLDNLYIDEERLTFANSFVLNNTIPENGKVKMVVLWGLSDESDEKKFIMINRSPNLMYEILSFMYDLSGEFYQKAGPWISNVPEHWKIIVNIKTL